MNSSRAPFITDAGAPVELRDSATGQVARVLPRYGVWVYDRGRGKYQVAECSNDLAALQAKYAVTVPVEILGARGA